MYFANNMYFFIKKIDLSASVVGRANAKTASRLLFAICNNPRLNTSIFYTILDEIVEEVFGIREI
jgi:sorting nexin-25